VESASPDRELAPPTPPPPAATSGMLVAFATLLCVLTYLEDALRCITLWEDQLSFVARHAGIPRTMASGALIVIATLQVLSTSLVLPPAAFPALAQPAMAVSVAVASSVLLQPFLFNQLSNTELLSLSAAQLGALGLIFGEAHAVAYPQAQPFAAFVTRAVPKEPAEIVQYVRFFSRILLTVDLIWVFGMRLVSPDTDIFPANLLHLFPLLGGLMVWLGFKTTVCAVAVAVAAFADAIHRYPFWSGGSNADFWRFHFFQALTPVGGMLLLAALGPGRFSIDAKAKRT